MRINFPFPPGDQGGISSCTAFAACAAFEYLIWKQYSKKMKLSEISLYKATRTKKGGSFLLSVLAHVDEVEKLHLYDPLERWVKEEEEVEFFYPAAPSIPLRIEECWKISYDQDKAISFYLDQEIPLLTSVSKVGHLKEQCHAVLLIGEDKNNYIFRNSWGSNKPIFRQKKEIFLEQVDDLFAITKIDCGSEIKYL